MSRRATKQALFSAVFLVACTGARETDLLGDAPAGAPTTQASPTEPAARDHGMPAPRNEASSAPPAMPDDASPSPPAPSSSSSSSSTSSSSSSGTPPGPWSSDGIACGTATCTPGATFCCDHGGQNASCTTPGLLACLGGTELHCDDRTDCPMGQVCCATTNALGSKTVQCQTQCNVGSAVQRLCDPSAPADECADIGKICTPGPSFAVCS